MRERARFRRRHCHFSLLLISIHFLTTLLPERLHAIIFAARYAQRAQAQR